MGVPWKSIQPLRRFKAEQGTEMKNQLPCPFCQHLLALDDDAFLAHLEGRHAEMREVQDLLKRSDGMQRFRDLAEEKLHVS